jgi:Fe-S oxidoreductase
MSAVTSKITPDWDIRDAILDLGGAEAYKCFQCGTCMAVCPWLQVDAVVFPVYRVPQSVKLGAIIADDDPAVVEREVAEVYRCVGCESCTTYCPHGVSQPTIMRAIRRILVEYESYPAELKDAVGRIKSAGNPFGEPREARGRWTEGLDARAFEPGMETLYTPCCVPAYDPRGRKVAEATVRVLNQAGVSFGHLGAEEVCCGEAIRKAGAEETFQEVAAVNIAAFASARASKHVVTSPHCLLAFTREYRELGVELEVLHQTQLFAQLLAEERLVPSKPLSARVVYHDPCTLGRGGGVFEEPRQVLSSIPGLELVEVPHYSRETSLCCGGGSGGMWLERPKGERMSDLRIHQLASTGAAIVAVACPYCLQMFEDSVKTTGLDLEVRDISELLAESL